MASMPSTAEAEIFSHINALENGGIEKWGVDVVAKKKHLNVQNLMEKKENAPVGARR